MPLYPLKELFFYCSFFCAHWATFIQMTAIEINENTEKFLLDNQHIDKSEAKTAIQFGGNLLAAVENLLTDDT